MLGAALFFILLLVGLFTFPIILGFLAFLWEKRLVWPYVSEVHFETEAERDMSNPYAPPGAGDPVAITPYASAVCLQAERLGFRSIGHGFDGKGKLYKIRYDFWLAPDQIVLAMVGGGTLAGISLEATWLYTLLGNGHCLLTLDEPKGGDSDMSGMTEQFVLAKADFAELLRRHRERIAAAESTVLPFSAFDPLTDLRAFRAARTDRLVELGLAKFLDEEHHWYKCTVRGALLAAVRSASREWIRAIRDRNRNQIKRPGETGYVPSGGRARGALAWINSLKSACWVLVFIGAFLSFRNGAARGPVNSAQLVFRVVVPTVGLLGLVVLWGLGLVLRRSTRADVE